MNITKRLDAAFIFILVIFCLNFFSAKFAAVGVFKNLSYAAMLGAILLSLPHFFRKSSGFIFPVQLIIVSIIVSIFVSIISWGQGLSYSVSTLPYLIWFLFFYLLYRKFPIQNIEITVIIYGGLYIILYFFQLLHSDVVYFGFYEEFKEDRGITRILFPGAGVFYLSYFIALNKFTEKTKFKWLILVFLFLGIVVTILQVTRQSIALLLLITIFHFLKRVSLVKKVAVIVGFSTVIIYFITSDNPISKGLSETQKETISDGDKYIRVLAGSYFISDFSPNDLSRVFGNGFPNNTSKYGRFTQYLEEHYGFYLSDVGLIGVYAMFGIFAVLGYILIFIKTLLMKVPEEYYYLKYYIWLLFVTCLTSDAVYSINFMITNVFVLYCYQYLFDQEKLKELMFSSMRTTAKTNSLIINESDVNKSLIHKPIN